MTFDMEIMTIVNDQSERSMLVYSCTISAAVQFGTELWVPLAFTFLYYMSPRASSTTSTRRLRRLRQMDSKAGIIGVPHSY